VLDEWECVTLTLLQRRNRRVFFLTVLDKLIIPAAESPAGQDAAAFYASLATSEMSEDVRSLVGKDDFDKMAGDIRIIEKSGRSVEYLADADKLRHFMNFNYFALTTSETLYGARDEGDAEDEVGQGDVEEDQVKSADDDSPNVQSDVDRARPPAAE